MAFILRSFAILLGLAGWGLLCTQASEYAVEVIQYVPGTGVGFDFITGESFTNPATALGPPAVDTTGDDDLGLGGIPVAETVPVVPVFPAFRADEMVTIGQGGSLILKFDHRVMDDPDNPYDLDLIVFGNSQMSATSGPWNNRDPAGSLLSNAEGADPARVSVSQDATNWFTFTAGPFSDSFAPTLGRVYDPANANTNIGAWNLWWAGPTDPTLPIDPAVSPTNLTGWSLQKLARHYETSAGGTGYDISGFALPVDGVTGFKWIQYVKVEADGALNPEVDAVSDVAVRPPYILWKQSSFSWLLDPTNRLDHANPDGDPEVNLMEYALNRDPMSSNSDSALTIHLVTTSTVPQVAVSYLRNTNAVDVDIRIAHATTLSGTWVTNGVVQEASIASSSNETERVTATLPAGSGVGSFRLEVEAP